MKKTVKYQKDNYKEKNSPYAPEDGQERLTCHFSLKEAQERLHEGQDPTVCDIRAFFDCILVVEEFYFFL